MNDTIRPDADNMAAPNLPLDKSNNQQADARHQASEKASTESWLDTAKHFVQHPVQDAEEAVLDFGNGALYASVQVPVDGAVQLANHITDKSYTAPALVSPPTEQNHATKAGEMVGTLVDAFALSQVVAGAAAAVGLTAGATLGGAIVVGAATMGVTGAIVGALSPVDKSSGFWKEKAEQIAIDGAAFGAMGGLAPTASTVFGTSLIGRTIGGAASGAAASSVQNFMEVAFGDDVDNGWSNLVKASLYGAAFGAASWAMDTAKENVQDRIAENHEQAIREAFNKDPRNNPPSGDSATRGHWTSSTDESGNVQWSRTYLDGGGRTTAGTAVADRVIIRPDGTQEIFQAQTLDDPKNFTTRILLRPDGSHEGTIAKPMDLESGKTFGPGAMIRHSDGTDLTFEGDKITVQNGEGAPIKTFTGSSRILRGQADTFPDQYIISQLKAAEAITDGVQPDQPGKSVLPDGTKITVDRLGPVWAEKPDGTVVITNPNGSRFVGLPDHTEIHDDGHGGIKVKYPLH